MGPSPRTPTAPGSSVAASAVLAAIEVGVLALDDRAHGVYANPAWARLTGQRADAWRGSSWQSLLLDAGERSRFLDAVGGGHAHHVEVHLQDTSIARVLHLDVVAAEDSGASTVVTARDVSEERALEDALSQAALRDPLTGLWNRNRFADFLAVALAHAERDHARRAAVFFVDVDDLKVINDRDGHAAGDRTLRAVAEALTAAVRPGDVVARFGGDEFVVLCDDVHDGEADKVATRILAAVESSPEAGCTVSVGIAVSQAATDDPSELIARADADMYEHKRRGRGTPGVDEVTPWASSGVRSEDPAELVWVLGAFVRLLRDRWETLSPTQRAELIAALEQVHARLELEVAGRDVDIDLSEC